ncbi:MAG TPA: DUF359 domain-containing protein [Pyrodictium delaneyi]|uniref:GTP-dependent dephospho-CoA kinase n=1 Tax=Pyrodictium delaneyi TaxID=1273541 RepID=A0A832ZSI3_9CREN|nr:DUF359 domain-containing protein [Pyrodictium delaneyi]
MSIVSSVLCMPDELRPLLASRTPRGRLVPSLANVLTELRYSRLIVIGDRVTRAAFKLGLKPVLAIYDCVEMRENVECPEPPSHYRRETVFNPRSSVSFVAARVIRDVIRQGANTAIQVYGEEDLLAIPAILYADIGYVVAYGQPSRGVVLVWVDSYVKRLVANLLRSFEPCSSSSPGKTKE